MEKQTWLSLVLPLIRSVLMLELALFVVTGLVCLLAGWRTLYLYGSALTLAGGVVLLVGALGGLGAITAAGKDLKAFSLTRATSTHSYLNRLFAENDRRLYSRIVILSVGSLAIAAGYFLQLYG